MSLMQAKTLTATENEYCISVIISTSGGVAFQPGKLFPPFVHLPKLVHYDRGAITQRVSRWRRSELPEGIEVFVRNIV